MTRMSQTHQQVISVLGGQHELRLLGLSRQANSFAVEYSIAPPLREPPMYLWLEATDELGNVYADWDGAHGPGPDGRQTLGTMTGRPALAPDAHTLTLRFVFMQGAEEHRYEVLFPLPTQGQ